MSRALVLKADIAASLRELGLEPGDVVIVHCSLGSFGFVCGGGADRSLRLFWSALGPRVRL